MTIIIKKADSDAQIKRKLERLSANRKGQSPKGFSAMKYLGKGIFNRLDGLEYQKKVRDEWGK